MNRIKERLTKVKEQNKKALITFVTAGDPDLATTIDLVLAMENSGADIIELGIPYSDPIAEGPVIQRANERALKHGIRTVNVFETVGKIREHSQIPLLFLLYYNCILKYGADKFFAHCKQYGVDGVIIPDLPFEQRGEIDADAKRYGIYIISLVAPTSGNRIEKIASSAEGFLYCVSSTGVTGVRNSFSTDFEQFFKTINRYTKIPTAIGFGISTPDHIKLLKGYSDGLIVGSAVVKETEQGTDAKNAVERVGAFVERLRKALDE